MVIEKALQQQPGTILGSRYQLVAPLGHGGMGSVYAAYDRLTRQQVALKRVNIGDGDRITSSADSFLDPRIALAQEFQVLATLRHPNIIAVLDYGFDAGHQPYFTMDLVDNPQTILEAATDRPFNVQIELLLQLLQALAYLHRRGFVHRDLKPGNILVAAQPDGLEIVKVLDLGLSAEADQATNMAGTLAYMAPELLMGRPATSLSDLFAVGVIAYQIFTGQHPFGDPNTSHFLQNVLHVSPNYHADGIDGRIIPILERLLAQKPEKRFPDAKAVIAGLTPLLAQTPVLETAATRESFLQAARFVGRERELNHLIIASNQARDGRGSAWLIAGESGVGKSRLANELRTRALVRGVISPRSQALLEGSRPYQLWEEIIRQLVLPVSLEDHEASVLKAVVSDIEQFIGYEIPEFPDLDPATIQSRLLETIEQIIIRSDETVLIILEDLHWASKESLSLIQVLSQICGRLPLMLVGTFRSDEAPDLPADLPEMTLLELKRLSPEAVIQLSESMMGQAGVESHIVNLLQRETEGNPFFLVEIVRALAEEAGQLDRVAAMELPEKIITGGLQQLIQRRITQVPPEYRRLLQTAAVAGHLLDLELLRTTAPSAGISDLEDWLTICANAAVLERQDNRWRFAHNKLREGILTALPADEQKQLHRQIAEAIEIIAPTPDEQAARLAYHWKEAGHPAKIVKYACLAADQALRVWANNEARLFFEQVIEALAELPENVENQQLYIDVALKLGRVAAFVPSIEVLTHLNRALELALALEDKVRQAQLYSSIGAYHYVRVQTSEAFDNFQKCMVLAELLELESLLVMPYNLIGRAYAILGNFEQAATLLARGIPLAEQFTDLELLAGSLAFYALTLAHQGLWQEATGYAQRALTLSKMMNAPERTAATQMVTGAFHAYCGFWEEARDYLSQAMRLGEELDALQLIFVCHGTLGYVFLQMGEQEKAVEHLHTCLALNEQHPQLQVNLPMYRAHWAECLFSEAGWEVTVQRLQEAIELAKTMNQPIGQAQARQSLARILLAAPEPDWQQAEQSLLDSIAIYERGNGLTYIAICRLELAQLYVASGRLPEAQTLLNESLKSFKLYNMTWYQKQAEQALMLLNNQE